MEAYIGLDLSFKKAAHGFAVGGFCVGYTRSSGDLYLFGINWYNVLKIGSEVGYRNGGTRCFR